VGTVSRLAPNRGHLSLLEAFVQVRAKFPEAQLLLTGKGEYRETIIQRAKTLGLQPGREVILTGYWDGDLRDILCLLDVFVLQSAGSEGTARALLEAMAFGLPAIVTRTDGMDDIVEDETSGIVVPPSDSGALSTKLISLLQDQNRAKIIGQKARERATSEFDQWVQAKRVETAYRMLLNSFRER
jgi:glycosyltransferase involved in cell wall biosynthesis